MPEVDRVEDDHDEIDDDEEPMTTDESSIDASSQDSDSIVSDDTEEPRHEVDDGISVTPDSADQQSSEGVVSPSPEDTLPSFGHDSPISDPVDSPELRRVEYVEGTNFNPPSRPLTRAGKTASRQLATHIPEPKSDQQPLGRTRGESLALLQRKSVADSSEPKSVGTEPR